MRLDDEAAQLEINRHIQEEKDEVFLRMNRSICDKFTGTTYIDLICSLIKGVGKKIAARRRGKSYR